MISITTLSAKWIMMGTTYQTAQVLAIQRRASPLPTPCQDPTRPHRNAKEAANIQAQTQTSATLSGNVQVIRGRPTHRHLRRAPVPPSNHHSNTIPPCTVASLPTLASTSIVRSTMYLISTGNPLVNGQIDCSGRRAITLQAMSRQHMRGLRGLKWRLRSRPRRVHELACSTMTSTTRPQSCIPLCQRICENAG